MLDFLRGEDSLMVLGTCKANGLGDILAPAVRSVMINPFGNLYNPVSVAQSIERLDSGMAYTLEDCIEMGAGAGKICSFEHHTSFARPSAEEFLQVANASLEKASAFWKECNKVIVVLGNARVWARNGRVVSNCLKRPGYEFEHYMLSYEKVLETLKGVVETHPDKVFHFCIVPIELKVSREENLRSEEILRSAVENCGAFSFDMNLK